MLRKSVSGLALLSTFFVSCDKKQNAGPSSVVTVRYSGEDQEPVMIEEEEGQWRNGTISLVAEGFDHEQLKIYLPHIDRTGDVKILNENNISFSDGLDFASTKILDAVLTITDMEEERVCGTFTISLLDDVGGVETRGIAGEFIVRKH